MHEYLLMMSKRFLDQRGSYANLDFYVNENCMSASLVFFAIYGYGYSRAFAYLDAS